MAKRNHLSTNNPPAPSVNVLNAGKYTEYFTELEVEKCTNLSDKSSEAGSKVYVMATQNGVFKAEPDGKLIPEQFKKCDYLIYAKNQPQLCFWELKGKNLSAHKADNPCYQISETIKYLLKEQALCFLFHNHTEIHAFIVSPKSQSIPKGTSSYERDLWKQLKNQENLHYVTVIPKGKYSNKGRRIVCSPKDPIPIPYISLR